MLLPDRSALLPHQPPAERWRRRPARDRRDLLRDRLSVEGEAAPDRTSAGVPAACPDLLPCTSADPGGAAAPSATPVLGSCHCRCCESPRRDSRRDPLPAAGSDTSPDRPVITGYSLERLEHGHLFECEVPRAVRRIARTLPELRGPGPGMRSGRPRSVVRGAVEGLGLPRGTGEPSQQLDHVPWLVRPRGRAREMERALGVQRVIAQQLHVEPVLERDR